MPGPVDPGTVHSASAKAGLLAMTRTLAVEWATHGIRVNCISPGPTDTEGAGGALWPTEADRERVAESIPLGRIGTPEEVAWWSTALCSSYGAWITGENLVIDGGHWLEQEGYLPSLGSRTRRPVPSTRRDVVRPRGLPRTWYDVTGVPGGPRTVFHSSTRG